LIIILILEGRLAEHGDSTVEYPMNMIIQHTFKQPIYKDNIFDQILHLD